MELRSGTGHPRDQRYTGTQVRGKQRRSEMLLDTTSPQDGYITVQRWADRDTWVHSSTRPMSRSSTN
jgi:hypothetical protein